MRTTHAHWSTHQHMHTEHGAGRHVGETSTMERHDARATWSLDFADPPRLKLDVDRGSIASQPVASGELPRLEVAGRNAERFEVAVKRKGDTVEVEVESHRWWGWGGGGDNHITLYVPANVIAEVHADQGTITAVGLGPCDLELATDAGRIVVEDAHGPMKVHSDAGSIRLRDVVTPKMEATTDAGQISLSRVRGLLHLRTDAGQIQGEHLRGRIDAYTDAGAIRLGY